jgi:hypothetical protein
VANAPADAAELHDDAAGYLLFVLEITLLIR